MKIFISNYRVVLLCESMMMCSAMAASILVQDVDHTKCSLDYIRQIVMESCIRPMRFRRHIKYYESSNNNYGFGIDKNFQHRPIASPRPIRVSLSHIPHHLLPVDSTLSIKRKSVRSKRSIDSQYDVYFHFCCNHMDICENLECP